MEEDQIVINQLKLHDIKNAQEFKVNNVEKIPNRYICFIKIKIFKPTKEGPTPTFNSKGSAVIIDEKYILTAAHNVTKYYEQLDKIRNNHMQPIDKSTVKLALHQGTNHGEYAIKKIRMSSKYNKKGQYMNDFALLELQAKTPVEREPSYPVILAFSEEYAPKIKQISILGYPIETNQKSNPNLSQSSIYITNMYESVGAAKRIKDFKIMYTLPTEAGFSGGGIFTQYQGKHVIIGIHKATQSAKKQQINQTLNNGFNFGVSAGQMLEEMNEWGYEIRKKPFVFTEKTLFLKEEESKLAKRQTLVLLDRRLDFYDILVITAYDLTNLTAITLSGNNLRDEGFQCLTRRKYPNLNSLHLNQNSITSFDKVPVVNWENISTLKTLGLSLNNLSQFSKNFSILINLETLWLSTNKFKDIPDDFVLFCQAQTRKIEIYFYGNKIKYDKVVNIEKKKEITKTMVTCFWTKQEKHDFFPQ